MHTLSKMTVPNSINITSEQMEVIRIILSHCYESLRISGDAFPKESRKWELVQHENLILTNADFINLDKILKIIY